MRRSAMVYRTLPLAIALLAAGCDGQDTAPTASPTETSTPTSTPAPVALDLGALIERQDPDRVLRYYAAALAAGDWPAAARAWGERSGVTADALKAEYGGKGPVSLDIAKGATEGAAGS